MWLDNGDLFKNVNDALYGVSGVYGSLARKVLKFVKKYFDSKGNPLDAFRSFQPAQFVKSIETPPVPLESREIAYFFNLYTNYS